MYFLGMTWKLNYIKAQEKKHHKAFLKTAWKVKQNMAILQCQILFSYLYIAQTWWNTNVLLH